MTCASLAGGNKPRLGFFQLTAQTAVISRKPSLSPCGSFPPHLSTLRTFRNLFHAVSQRTERFHQSWSTLIQVPRHTEQVSTGPGPLVSPHPIVTVSPRGQPAGTTIPSPEQETGPVPGSLLNVRASDPAFLQTQLLFLGAPVRQPGPSCSLMDELLLGPQHPSPPGAT